MKKIIVLALLHTGVAISDLPKIINLPKLQLPQQQRDVQNLLSILGAQNEAEGIKKATAFVEDQNALKIIKGMIGEQDTPKTIDILQSIQRALPNATSLREAPDKIKELSLAQGHLERIKRIMHTNDAEKLIKDLGSMEGTIKNQQNEIELLKQNKASSIPVAPPIPTPSNIPPAPPIVAPNIPPAPAITPLSPTPVSAPTNDLLKEIQGGKKLTPPKEPTPKKSDLLTEIRGGKNLKPVSSRPTEAPKKDLKGTLEQAMESRRQHLREGDEEENGADDSEWNE